jgi:maltooligosyltrehalose trehalohydrolase
MFGERLTDLVSFEKLKLAAGVTLLSPYLPMLFMGEEYAETAPFQFFVSYLDPALNDAVREGRKAEFKTFDWQHEPPDPASPETFERSKLNHDLKNDGRHRTLYELYGELIRIRRTDPALAFAERERMDVRELSPGDVARLHLWTPRHEFAVLYSFDEQPRPIDPRLPAGEWQFRLDSADARWNGPREQPLPESQRFGDGNTVLLLPHSFLVLTRNRPPDWPDWA